MSREMIIGALTKVQGYRESGTWPDGYDYGICARVDSEFPTDGEGDDAQAAWDCAKVPAFAAWAEFSGDLVYPVLDRDNPQATQQQFHTADHWDGRQGELRDSLLAHLVEWFKHEYNPDVHNEALAQRMYSENI